MARFKRTRKVFRFGFISMPLAILGRNSLVNGNQFISSLWGTLRNPHCPHCDTGVLAVSQDNEQKHVEDDDKTQYLWRCNRCDYGVFAPNHVDTVKKLVGELRRAALINRLSDIEASQINEISRAHRNASRTYYGASLVMLLGALYMIASGASFITIINWFVIGCAIGTFGLVKAYRSWQVRSGNLFVEGAFMRWLRDERWFY